MSIGATLVFSYLGYTTKEVVVRTLNKLTISLEESISNMQDIVVTGMMTRKKSSFTGTEATFTGAELKAVGNQNVLQSIRTLDPSFILVENNSAGSNPNVDATINVRGQTSISNNALRDEFSADPNQPLYILDGFPTTQRMIQDLDMNVISTITILKDAASTAIYGSKGSNGVVVIETQKPAPGKVRLSYSSDLSTQLSDLSSYNMMNAREKLEFERLAGAYYIYYNTQTPTADQIVQDSIYNSRLKEVNRGVDTYWLAQPLQTGFSQRHSLNIRGGSDAVRFDLGGNYRIQNSVMKGNKRNDFGANSTISYRNGIFNAVNQTRIQGSSSEESPYGTFSTWVNTNPYLRLKSSSEPFLESVLLANGGPSAYNVPNPLYDAGLQSFNKGSSLTVINNLALVASLSDHFQLQGNAQISRITGETDVFQSPLRSNYLSQPDPTLRGRLANRTTRSFSYTANLMATYGKIFDQKHSVNVNLRGELRENQNKAAGFTAIGFPNASNGNASFAYGYASGAKPSASTRITRENSLVGALNYSFDQRYNFDFNYSINGTTAFGSKNPFQGYYSVGASWNIHNEAFAKKISWIDLLRLRANVGETGNQNFNGVSESVYTYYDNINATGQGVYLSGLGAPDLKWQNTLNYNLSIDATFLKKRIDIQVNAFRKITNPLVVAVTLPSSTGLSDYPFNAGALTVNGIETSIAYAPIYRPADRIFWRLRVTGSTQTQKYSKFNNILDKLNKDLNSSNALIRYKDGYSPFDIWAVPSLGIDPATGREIFVQQNGQQTFIYNPADRVVVGSSQPKVEGVMSSTVTYKAFSANISLRYIVGRDIYNSALANKVENINIVNIRNNQDKRALYDRWKAPGDISQFIGIGFNTVSTTSRFVQRESIISGESINLSYEFTNKTWLDKAALSNLRLSLGSRDLFNITNVQRERGIDYPFAKEIQMSLVATFK